MKKFIYTSVLAVLTLMTACKKEEQNEILEYAVNIAKQNNARNVNYLITLLNEWIIEDIQTKNQAVSFHDQTYGETLPDMENIKPSEDFLNAMDLWKES